MEFNLKSTYSWLTKKKEPRINQGSCVFLMWRWREIATLKKALPFHINYNLNESLDISVATSPSKLYSFI